VVGGAILGAGLSAGSYDYSYPAYDYSYPAYYGYSDPAYYGYGCGYPAGTVVIRPTCGGY